MRELVVLLVHVLATMARLAGPGGVRAVVAESVLVKQQLLILNRSRKRSPRLRLSDRVVAGLCALLMRPRRLVRVAIVLKPSTLLRFHRALTTRKYRALFSSTGQQRPGPKGPSQDVIAAVVDMKRRNPTWGCPRIAQQITWTFGIPLNKDVVRRILARRYTPTPDPAGPSWLTVLGHAKDSLWSVDLFRCESAILRAYWVLVVMDQCTRRIVGFGVQRGAVDGAGLCRMFNRAIRGHTPPKYLSSDHDRLFEFHQWQANLRILDIDAVKTVPYAPLSHPFVERLIGTIRRECVDRTLFWTAADLERKLVEFQGYYNGHRVHAALNGRPPAAPSDRGCAAREPRCVPLAAALSRALSHADRGVSRRAIPHARRTAHSATQPGVCVLFHGSTSEERVTIVQFATHSRRFSAITARTPPRPHSFAATTTTWSRPAGHPSCASQRRPNASCRATLPSSRSGARIYNSRPTGLLVPASATTPTAVDGSRQSAQMRLCRRRFISGLGRHRSVWARSGEEAHASAAVGLNRGESLATPW